MRRAIGGGKEGFGGGKVEVEETGRAVCEDDRNSIVRTLQGWGSTELGEEEVGIIITTGGTGEEVAFQYNLTGMEIHRGPLKALKRSFKVLPSPL